MEVSDVDYKTMLGTFKEIKDRHKIGGGGTEATHFCETKIEILELKKYHNKNLKLSGQV